MNFLILKNIASRRAGYFLSGAAAVSAVFILALRNNEFWVNIGFKLLVLFFCSALLLAFQAKHRNNSYSPSRFEMINAKIYRIFLSKEIIWFAWGMAAVFFLIIFVIIVVPLATVISLL